MAGESCGTMELVPTPVSKAKQFAVGIIDDPDIGYIRSFDSHYTLAQTMAMAGLFMRSQMPVIEEGDIEDFKRMLHNHGGVGFEERYIEAQHLNPLQKQIYADKSIDATLTHGIENTKNFLGQVHIFVTEQGDIIDGHHRWLSAMLLDPSLKMKAMVVEEDDRAAIQDALDFSDSQGYLRNA